MTSKGLEGEIDFSDQINQLAADEKAGYPPNCNKGYEEKDGKCVKIVEDEAKDKEDKDKDKDKGKDDGNGEKGKDGKKLPPWLNKKKKNGK